MSQILGHPRWPTTPLAFCAGRQPARKWKKAERSNLTQRDKPSRVAGRRAHDSRSKVNRQQYCQSCAYQLCDLLGCTCPWVAADRKSSSRKSKGRPEGRPVVNHMADVCSPSAAAHRDQLRRVLLEFLSRLRDRG